ncbi:EAL domain-containing protein [Shewanella sp. 1_MG-2023]|uniref:bifunctional diguanylate cyclase/phosphodiesterase n=1 Tax=unclassified Shewanella TaxID=196818 RepID=UPI0026E15DA1|nr:MULTISPECIES: EAL domain-containing protein [unclassified Shewanella]MDO6613526.1 EAL domain-containing protein [Shewanella sp. 7_MG-2023]MDO6773356.1 EAL domain-containing protein [Shewanella sp. 2_MG-2023]MDO6796007.1 EAL domain-containing protein [Shewanella sp. 1_MG-2023]
MSIKKGLSLKTQLYLLIACLTIFTFSASLYNNITSMQTYLEDQLSSHAQDAAHSLGLSISPYMDEEELVIAKTMTNALFDSGYYQSIAFYDLNEKIIFSRTNPHGTQHIPNWFIKLFLLSPPVMTSEVSNGWVIAGKIKVQSHSGSAYNTLWNHSKNILWITCMQLCIALIAGFFILKAVLYPLKGIERQANAVATKQFEINSEIPYTTELRAVVNALNKMVENIRQTFQEQTQLAESLSKQVYLDSQTDLPNRRALLKRFDSYIVEANETGSALYMNLISMTSLKQINDSEGYSAGDNYITEAANLFKKQITPFNQITMFRVSGSEFIILSLMSSNEAEQLNSSLNESISLASNTQYPQGFAKHVSTKVDLSESFTCAVQRCDTEIATQQYYLNTQNNQITASDSQGHSRIKWLEILKQFIAYSSSNNTQRNLENMHELDSIFELMLQPIINNQKDLMYVESFLRFKLEDEVFSTPEVFAMAERLHLSSELEQAVVSFIFHKLLKVKQAKIAINIGNSAIHDESFTNWLFQIYQQHKAQLPQLIFEINESAAMASVESTKQFISRAKQVGIEITLERFGANLSSFSYIKNMDIDYIKLDGGYIRDLEEADSRFFVQTVTQICHGIGIKIIAPHVENITISTHCLQMNIDGLQGNGLYPVSHYNTIVSSKEGEIETILLLNRFNTSTQIKE